MCGGGGPDPVEETEAARESAKIAVEQYNIGKDLEPLKDYQEDSVAARRTEGAESFVQGKANLGIQKEFSKGLSDAKRGMYNAGVDPSSGRATGLDTEAYTSMGDASSDALFNSAYENESQGLAGVQNIINTSMGKAGTAQKGLSDIANLSTQEAINDSFNDFNEHASNTQALGMAAGVAASGYQNTTDKGEG